MAVTLLKVIHWNQWHFPGCCCCLLLRLLMRSTCQLGRRGRCVNGAHHPDINFRNVQGAAGGESFYNVRQKARHRNIFIMRKQLSRPTRTHENFLFLNFFSSWPTHFFPHYSPFFGFHCFQTPNLISNPSSQFQNASKKSGTLQFRLVVPLGNPQ